MKLSIFKSPILCSPRCDDSTELGLRYSQRDDVKEEKVDDAILMAEVMAPEEMYFYSSVFAFLFIFVFRICICKFVVVYVFYGLVNCC